MEIILLKCVFILNNFVLCFKEKSVCEIFVWESAGLCLDHVSPPTFFPKTAVYEAGVAIPT